MRTGAGRGSSASKSWAIACVVFLLSQANVGAVQAQEQGAGYEKDTQAARALFHAGLAYADEKEWQLAADRFEQSLELRESAVVEYNLSAALVEMGRLSEAARRLQSLVDASDAEPEVRTAAEKLLSELRPELGSLRVLLQGDLRHTQLRIDDRKVAATAAQEGVPVGSGVHVVTAERGVRAVVSQRVRVQPGQATRVSLEVPPYVPGPEEAARLSHASGTRNAGHTSARDDLVSSPWFWGGIGLVTAATVVTVVLLASSGDGDDAMMTNALRMP